jgi:hypothetical protein
LEDTQLDELEVAERKIKEQRRKAHQRKKGVKRRKVVRTHESSDEDNELQSLRNQLLNEPD